MSSASTNGVADHDHHIVPNVSEGGHVSLVGQMLPQGVLPEWVGEKYGTAAVQLDLTDTGLWYCII